MLRTSSSQWLLQKDSEVVDAATSRATENLSFFAVLVNEWLLSPSLVL